MQHPISLLKVSVIGHTNTGKTSLMRTLLKNDSFGQVANSSATTRDVTQSTINAHDGSPLLALIDTPGMEDGTGVMDYLDAHTASRKDGIDRLREFLTAVQHGSTSDDFSQEAKVINATIDSDVAIYVIDARFAPTSKYKDELALLSYTSTPILPVFNFVADSVHLPDWEEILARRSLHVVNRFDTVAFDFESEMQLWQNLATLVKFVKPLTQLIDERRDDWQELLETGTTLIADFLINVASFTQKINEDHDPSPTIKAMQQAVRTLEREAVEQLLGLYKFYHTPATIEPLQTSLQTSDPFDPLLIKHYGLRTASGSSVGAIIGAGVDVATLGASLGLGTVVGGILGGGLANADIIKDKAMGLKRLSIDDNTLLVLANRLMGLHSQLRHTGHATQNAFLLSSGNHFVNQLPKALQKAQSQTHYSDLSIDKAIGSKRTLRAELADKLAMELIKHYPNT